MKNVLYVLTFNVHIKNATFEAIGTNTWPKLQAHVENIRPVFMTFSLPSVSVKWLK